MIRIVIGGQYGSEGKGEFVAYLSERERVDRRDYRLHVVRTGGPNAGHTMTVDSETHKMRQIPCAWHTDANLYIAAGSLISPEVLRAEIEMVLSETGRGIIDVVIDPQAIMIYDRHVEDERGTNLRGEIGSTTEGIGAARRDHLSRKNADILLGNITERFGGGASIAPVSPFLNKAYDNGDEIILESTQGFDLSIAHSGHYPFTTSRDITPGIILNDAGLSSRLDHEVIAVIRTFPIRVAGNSGPMAREVTWEEMQKDAPHIKVPETTTVTGLTRRIGNMEIDRLEQMVEICRPDYICLTFLDYVFPDLYRVTDPTEIMNHSGVYRYLSSLSDDIDCPIRWVSTGPGYITEIEA